MNEIKPPSDSLYYYFEELLSDDEDATAPAEQLSIFPIEIPAVRTTLAATAPPAALARKTEAKVTTTKPHFADPIAEQKQKLQKLLYSVRPKIAVAPVVKVAEVIAPVVTATPFRIDPNEIQEWNLETSPAIVVEAFTSPIEIAEQQVAVRYQMPGLEWLPNGLPQWAQTRFDVLLFKVSGLTLAVPLISLGKIQPINDELTPLFGQADWFMGLLPTSAGKIRTVNTAKFVMPERYDENFAKNAKYVVSINGVPWGLAVDSVNQPIRLEPDAVKWRTNRSKRPWLAGTIKEHMCALLDIPMIGQMLMDADKNFVKSRLG